MQKILFIYGERQNSSHMFSANTSFLKVIWIKIIKESFLVYEYGMT